MAKTGHDRKTTQTEPHPGRFGLCPLKKCERKLPPRRGWGILGLCFYKDVAPTALGKKGIVAEAGGVTVKSIMKTLPAHVNKPNLFGWTNGLGDSKVWAEF